VAKKEENVCSSTFLLSSSPSKEPLSHNGNSFASSAYCESSASIFSIKSSRPPDRVNQLPQLNSKRSEYGSKAKITCRCKKCGNEWKATPNGLLHGYGCQKCGIKSRAEKSKKKVLCVEKNMVYDSLKDASAQSGNRVSSISNCCNGRVKTAGGYHWEFVSDD
jgi:hypothetical protein